MYPDGLKKMYVIGNSTQNTAMDVQLTQSVQHIGSTLDGLSRDIVVYAQNSERRMAEIERKRKKKLTNCFLTARKGGKVVFAQMYDDGSYDAVDFMLNIIGEWKVYRVEFSDCEVRKSKFAIIFEESRQWIIGDYNKNSARGLYEYFVKAGIVFNPQITKAKVGDALFQCFGSEIQDSAGVLEIPGLAGWKDGKFNSAETFSYLCKYDFVEVPILRKQFERISDERKEYGTYFSIMNGIKEWRDRLLIMVFPLAGMLASMLATENVYIPFSVNFVDMLEYGKYPLCELWQVFNRKQLRMQSLDGTEKELNSILASANDEVLIFDARTDADDSTYRRNKIRNNAEKAHKKIVGRKVYASIERDVSVALAFVSKEMMLKPNVRNIFLSNDFFEGDAILEKQEVIEVVTRIYSEFVKFVEGHYVDVGSIIMKNRGIRESEMKFWQIMIEILGEFWTNMGVNVTETAKLPKKIDIKQLCVEVQDDANDLIIAFVKCVRSEIGHFTSVRREKYVSGKDTMICYDDTYVWIPPKVLRRMLSLHGLLPKLNTILSRLKADGSLHTDSEGFSRRLQTNGERREMYQIRRDIFDIPGGVDLIDLTKEDLGNAQG